jgi:hypothetical protein
MGGLVSRWFIERESGNKTVQHLIMLGTPNAGSPWSTVQELATTCWPAAVLGGLVTALERVDVTLDQMRPGAKFLQLLAASPDPGIPYTLIAGNTSKTSPCSNCAGWEKKPRPAWT